ncbi:unnamed protein product [Oikopleura dioica]|uniref:HAT C-terminal dimerisation domain-containing protein n=1 Tax=Oikopleura dioica TaxID=34765 RepID=E4XMV1_OIKDI|nr:unnamed protein product [Oikopleura dioica]
MLEPFILSAIDYLVGSDKRLKNKRGAPIVSRADILPIVGYMLRIPNRKCKQLTLILDTILKSTHISKPSKESILVIFVELKRDWENDCYNIVRELAALFEYKTPTAINSISFAEEDLNSDPTQEPAADDSSTKIENEITRFKNFSVETYCVWTRTNVTIQKCVEFMDSHSFPILAKVLRIAFTTPAGTGNLERFFSTLKYIFTSERARISEETLSKEFVMHGRALHNDFLQSLKKAAQ